MRSGGRGRRRRTAGGLLLAAALACCGSPSPGRAELVEVAHPDLAGMDPLVAERLTGSREALDRLLARREIADAGLGRAFGEAGMLYQAYALLDAAADCYENAGTLTPGEPRWPYYLGRVRRAQGRNELAAASFRRVLELVTDHVPALVQLADVELEASRLDDAESLLQIARAAEPESAAVAFALGRVAAARRDYAAAVEHFEGALRSEPRATAIHYPLALAHRALGNEERARGHLERRGKVAIPDPLMAAVRRLAESWSVDLQRGSTLFAEGHYEQAATAFRRATTAAPDEAGAHSNLGSALHKLGDYAGARLEFEEAVRLDPREAKARFNLGTLCARLGEDEQAVEHYSAALIQAPEMFNAQFNLANALRRLGRFEEALPHYRVVVEQNPGLVAPRQAEVFTLIRLHRFEEALLRAERGLAASPGDRPLRHARVRLLAASPVDRVRDGERALEMARALLADERSIHHVVAAAMAAAEAGRFDQALLWQGQAIEAARGARRSDMLPELEELEARFRRGEPSRRPWPDDSPVLSPPSAVPPDGAG